MKNLGKGDPGSVWNIEVKESVGEVLSVAWTRQWGRGVRLLRGRGAKCHLGISEAEGALEIREINHCIFQTIGISHQP